MSPSIARTVNLIGGTHAALGTTMTKISFMLLERIIDLEILGLSCRTPTILCFEPGKGLPFSQLNRAVRANKIPGAYYFGSSIRHTTPTYRESWSYDGC